MTAAIEAALRRLSAEFPDAPRDVITSLFTDSYLALVEVSRSALVAKTEELTRLRLEVRTRHPAHRQDVA